jgi:hypothetical protein
MFGLRWLAICPMARIMIRCPNLKWPVPTGLTTDMVKLDSMFHDLTLTVRCPVCDCDHEWKLEDAWVESGNRKANFFDNGHGRMT